MPTKKKTKATKAPKSVADILRARVAKIKRENAKFKACTKAEKRVMIAKDVLAQLKSGRINPESGVFVELGHAIAAKLNQIDEDTRDGIQLQDFLLSVPVCNTCALGAMFVCTVERANKISLSESGFTDFGGAEPEELLEYMGRYFSASQLKLIEVAFEHGTGYFGHGPQEAREWSSEYTTDTDAMRAIMQNIVDNDGTFKPVVKGAKR
jgi:hypothetical protein